MEFGLLLWLSWWRIHLQCGRPGFDPWVGKIPWRRESLPTPVFWPGEFYGLLSMGSQRVGYDWVTFTSLSRIPFFALDLSTAAEMHFIALWSVFEAFPVAQCERIHLPVQETQVWSLGPEDPLEEATHSSIPAWRIPWTEEPGRLVSGSAQSWTWLSKWRTGAWKSYVCLLGT